MKKLTAILLALLLLCACALAEEEEPYRWSDPSGKYLTDALEPVCEIRSEQEAEAYAEELWAKVFGGSFPEGRREMSVDAADNSYHFSVFNEEGWEIYTAHFLSNGAVQAIGRAGTPLEWSRIAERFDAKDVLDEDAWAQIRTQVEAQVEALAPGVLQLVNPLTADTVFRVENTQFILVYGEQIDADYDSGLVITVVVDPEGTVTLLDYSCYGAG